MFAELDTIISYSFCFEFNINVFTSEILTEDSRSPLGPVAVEIYEISASVESKQLYLPLLEPTLWFAALCVSHPWTLFIHPLTWQHPAC